MGFLLEPPVKELDHFPLFIGSTDIHSFSELGMGFDFLFVKRTSSGATIICMFNSAHIFSILTFLNLFIMTEGSLETHGVVA